MTIANYKIKLIKILHDAKAILWTKAGPCLKQVKTHSKILNKVLIQDNGFTFYRNELEGKYYRRSTQIKFFHPATYLYILKDVWVTGSEGHLFFEPHQLFTVCSSITGLEFRKIRRPIKPLAQPIEKPIFILSGRAPGNRGHFLVEHLPRLVASADVIKRFGGCKILVTPNHRKWQVGYLEKLGIPESDVVESSVGTVFCKKALYVPMMCHGERATVSHKKYYQILRDRFLDGQKPSGKGFPAFLSRKDAPDRKLINEDAIFSVAKMFFPGIRRVVLSNLSLNEQIKLFQVAPIVIGPHSQPFRNLLFSSRSLAVQLIQGFRDSSNEYYHWAQNYNFLGSIGENLCLPLFNEIKFYKNSDWLYPEDKFEKDISKLISLLDKQNIRSNYGL